MEVLMRLRSCCNTRDQDMYMATEHQYIHVSVLVAVSSLDIRSYMLYTRCHQVAMHAMDILYIQIVNRQQLL